MKIGTDNEKRILNEVVESLVDHQSQNSWTLVVPPGFGEQFVPQAIADRLRAHPTELRIAFVKADTVKKKADLLRQLWEPWRKDSTTPSDEPNWDTAELGDVLSKVDQTRKRILVISRFHRILDWVDESILQNLRDAEQARVIQTVVVSMYPLDWIKREWREKGSALLASDYGVEHSKRKVQPLQPGECFQMYRSIDGQQVPPELVRLAIGWTGGYPECMHAVMDEWVSHNRPDWSMPEWQRRLFNKATDFAGRMAEAVDHQGSTSYRGLVVDLHLQSSLSIAYERLKRAHPWGEILLDDSGLRSDAVGEACLNLEVKERVEADDTSTPSELWYANCVSLYRSRQYTQVVQIVGEKPKPNDTPAVQLLRNSALIMDAIYARGVDVDWQTVASTSRHAKEWLKAAPISERDKNRILDRIGAIEELAASLSRVSTAGSRRKVDSLAGLERVADGVDHKMALTLLLLQFESARATRGNSDSIQKSLSMTEQVLRVWSWWHLGLNYYDTHSGCESTWRLAAQAWRTARGIELTESKPGAQFPGIVAFAYFAVAALVERSTPPQVPVPAMNFAELEKQLFVFDWRNDAAHSVAVFDAKNRRKFFEVLDRWLECLCACVPQGPVSRESLLSVIEPLPMFQDESLVWRP